MLKRYGNIEYLNELGAQEFIEIVLTATTKATEEKARDQWLALYPFMALKMIKNITLDNFVDMATGRDLDLRPDNEILKEAQEALEALGRGTNG